MGFIEAKSPRGWNQKMNYKPQSNCDKSQEGEVNLFCQSWPDLTIELRRTSNLRIQAVFWFTVVDQALIERFYDGLKRMATKVPIKG